MRPEVAKEVLAHYPELVDAFKSALTEEAKALESILNSDDASIKEYYDIANKELDNAAESRKMYYEFAKQELGDCKKLLENPNLPPETIIEILNREKEIRESVSEKDSEIREHEKAIEDKVYKKDSEKRQFNWKAFLRNTTFVVAAVAISAGVLGGNVNMKLPSKD